MDTTPRHIDADAFYTHIQNKLQTEFVPFATLLDEIKKFPTEDVAPIIHAHWIVHERVEEWFNLLIPNYECSHCHEYVRPDGHGNWCKNCGAKMDEKEG